VAVWEDVVTAGLIGTDRRPVPDGLPPSWGSGIDQTIDPAHAVLSLAARHRAAIRAGGRLPSSCPPAPAAPPNREPIANRAAHEILVRLLSPPQIDLLNLWLIAATEHGQCVSAAYWTSFAMVAARPAELDRTLLARVLGDRGVWFVAQNPQWARLAKGLQPDTKEPYTKETDTKQTKQDVSPPNVSGVELTEDAVRVDPEVIMRGPQPWSEQVTRAVLDIIASGRLQQRGTRYAAAAGARLPLHHYESLRLAVRQLGAPDVHLTSAALRSVREALLVLERTVWLRIEMQSAFSGDPIMVQRVELPQW
jgi:hypothetical protein